LVLAWQVDDLLIIDTLIEVALAEVLVKGVVDRVSLFIVIRLVLLLDEEHLL